MGEANSDTVKEEKEKVFYGTVPEEGRKMKRVSDSLTEASRLIIPADLNSSGRLFGGRLLEWLDEMAGIVAKRHAECSVVTAAIDNLHFKEGATVSDTIFMLHGGARRHLRGKTDRNPCPDQPRLFRDGRA